MPPVPILLPAGRFFNEQKTVPLRVLINIINDGDTKAFNVRATGCMSTTGTPDGTVQGEGYDLAIPGVIRDANTDHPVQVEVAGMGINDYVLVDETIIRDICEAKVFLHMFGVIFYEDVFENSHRTPFHYRWNIWGER